MRVLILNFILSTAVDGRIIRRQSNGNTMIYNMARGFIKAGHEVTLCAADEFRPLEEDTHEFEVRYFKSRWPKIFKPYLLPLPKGLGRFLKREGERFDMIVSVDTFSFPTLICARKCRKKLLVWQEMAFMQGMMKKMPAKIWYNFIAPTFIGGVRVVAQSERSKAFISKYLKNVSDITAGHGVDSDIFYPAETRGRWFVVISMLVFRKRIDRILEKFAGFIRNSDEKDYMLEIVGEGPEEANLRRRAEELDIAGHVRFNGFMTHEEIAAKSREATALLVDTQQDNNMVTITESIANGTPVLTNCVPNNASTVARLGLGIAKDGWDWNELATMAREYDRFHANCMKHRHFFTSDGVACQLIESFRR